MGTETHWLAVIVAAILGFVIGGLWYGPVFGKKWQSLSELSDERMQAANMPMIFALVALLNLFSAFILDHVLGTYGRPDLSVTMMITGGIALAFVVPAFAINYLFARKPLALFAIDAGYWLLIYVAMGAALSILG